MINEKMRYLDNDNFCSSPILIAKDNTEIKNKKIKLLDDIDKLIEIGISYEDIIKAIEIHKQLSE